MKITEFLNLIINIGRKSEIDIILEYLIRFQILGKSYSKLNT